MKYYTLEDIERLIKEKQPLDMSKISLEHTNPTAYKYIQDMEKAEKFSRDTWLGVMSGTVKATEELKLQLECANLSLQGLDFAKNSKEGVKFNWQQGIQRFKQYNEMLKAEQEKKKS